MKLHFERSFMRVLRAEQGHGEWLSRHTHVFTSLKTHFISYCYVDTFALPQQHGSLQVNHYVEFCHHGRNFKNLVKPSHHAWLDYENQISAWLFGQRKDYAHMSKVHMNKHCILKCEFKILIYLFCTIWRWEGSLECTCVLSVHSTGPRNRTRVLQSGGKLLPPPSHRKGPKSALKGNYVWCHLLY